MFVGEKEMSNDLGIWLNKEESDKLEAEIKRRKVKDLDARRTVINEWLEQRKKQEDSGSL